MSPEEYERLDDKEKMGAERPDNFDHPEKPKASKGEEEDYSSSGGRASTPKKDGGFSDGQFNDHPLYTSSHNDFQRPEQGSPSLTDRIGSGMGQLGGRASALFKRRGVRGAILGGGGIIGMIVTAFLTLGPLKLEHMMQNLDQAKFGPMEHTYNMVSDAYMRDYMKVRLATGGDADRETQYWRSKGIDPASPFVSWYKYMRASSFEKDLADHQGIRFVNNGNGDVVKLRVSGSDMTINSASEVDDIFNTNIDAGSTGEHKRARLAIRDAVNKETYFFQIIKRHNMRKWMQASLGVQKWKFFEKSREKPENFVRSTYAKYVLTPTKSHVGDWIDCVFGGNNSKCSTTDSLNDSRNQAGAGNGSASGTGNQVQEQYDEAIDEVTDPGTDTPKLPEASGSVEKRALAPLNMMEALLGEKIAAKVIPFINVMDLLNMADSADSVISNNTIGKIIVVRNELQYASYVAPFVIAVSQMHDMKTVDPGQMNALLNKFNGIENSCGYNQVMNKDKPLDCSIDDSKKINNASVDKFSQNYKDSDIHKTAAVILSPWRAIKGLPIVGQIVSGIGGVLGWLGGKLVDVVASTGLDPSKILSGLITKLASFALTAVVDGSEIGGKAFDALTAGFEVIASQFMQSVGGHAMTAAEYSQLTYQSELDQQAEQQNASTISKVASLSNTNSLASRLVDALPLSTGQVQQTSQQAFAMIANPARMFFNQSGHLSLSALFGDAHANTQSSQSLFNVSPNGFSDSDLPDPTTLTDQFCNDQISAWDDAMSSGDMSGYEAKYGKHGSPCKLYQSFMDATKCKYNTSDTSCGGVQQGSASDCIDAINTATGGNISALADEMLSKPNITYWTNNGANTRDVIQQLKDTGEAKTTCANAPNPTTDVNPNILRAILEYASDGTPIMVNAITDKCHDSPGSNHYKGKAVDFECQAVNFNIDKMDEIAAKYGGHRNGETCDGNSHWHYDFTANAESSGPSDDSGQPSGAVCSDTDSSSGDVSTRTGSRATLAAKLLSYAPSKLQFNNPGVQKPDITKSRAGGGVDDNVVKLMLAIIEDGHFKLPVTALRSDHFMEPACNTNPKCHGHGVGAAIDIGYASNTSEGQDLYKWIFDHKDDLHIAQMIYKYPAIGKNNCVFDGKAANCDTSYPDDINDHADHIHVSVYWNGDGTGKD